MSSTIDEAARTPSSQDPSSTPSPAPSARPGNRLVARLRPHWPLLALAVAAGLISVLAQELIYPAYSYNRDEPVYRWMADHLLAGELTPPDGGAPDFFFPWLGAARDGGFFSHFTLGWPAVLVASDLLLGTHAGAPVLGAVLIVLGTYALAREVTGDRSLALVAAGVMTASPILPVQGGAFLGYLFTTGLGLLFAAALLSGARLQRPRRLVLAGALLGWIFLTRPFDAVLWGVAVGAYLVLVRWGRWRQLVRTAGWVLPGLLPLLVVALAYNQLVVGGFFQLPNSAADPLDTFGFGDRRMMPAFDGTEYGVARAFRATVKNGGLLPLFLGGGYLGLLVAGVGLWLRRRERSTLVLLAIIAIFPLTYFFHWGTWISSLVTRWGGPIYFIPLFGPLCILIATAVVAAWRRRVALGIGLVVLLALGTVPGMVRRIDANHRLSLAQVPWRESVASIDGEALVFVGRSSPYLQFFNPFSANDPELDGDLLYAADRGPANLDLISRLPEREAYFQRPTLPGDDLSVPRNNPARFPPGEMMPRNRPPVPDISVIPIEVVEGGGVALSLRGRNPDDDPAVTAFVDLGDGSGPRWQTLTADGDGDYVAEWTVRAPGSAGPGLPLTGRLGTLAVGLAYGESPERARQASVRQLLSYRLDAGAVEVLVPADQQRRRTVRGREGWFQAQDLPELDVEVRPAS